MKSATKAQAKLLANIWICTDRSVAFCIAAPLGLTVYNGATLVALRNRGWIVPSGHPDITTDNGGGCYTYQEMVLSWAGMKALADFITKECILSSQDEDEDDD